MINVNRANEQLLALKTKVAEDEKKKIAATDEKEWKVRGEENRKKDEDMKKKNDNSNKGIFSLVGSQYRLWGSDC